MLRVVLDQVFSCLKSLRVYVTSFELWTSFEEVRLCSHQLLKDQLVSCEYYAASYTDRQINNLEDNVLRNEYLPNFKHYFDLSQTRASIIDVEVHSINQ